MRRWIAAGVGVVLLGGCAAPRLETSPERFAQQRSATVPPATVEQFVACLTTGFDEAHWMFTNVTVRQTRQVGATRVETLTAGRLPVVVVTVQDSGVATMHEARGAMFINTTGERDAFDACAQRYAEAT